MAAAPIEILREYTGLNVTDFARETQLSRNRVYGLQGGDPAGGVAIRKIKARWSREMAACRLTVDDFIEGKVLGGPGQRRAAS